MPNNFIISSHQETTIDYPGKMSVIVFTPGCNFRCGFCHNPELVYSEGGNVDVGILLKNISAKAGAGWYQGVCISGGEPTLQRGLIDFCKKLKDIGVAVKLDTNGSNPQMLRELLDKNLVDYVAMDIKSGALKYSEIAGVEIDFEKINDSIKLAREFPFYEFRTTVLPSFTAVEIEEIGKLVSDNGKSKVRLFTLQQFSPKNTLDESFMKLIPQSKEEIEKYAMIIKKYADNVRVLA